MVTGKQSIVVSFVSVYRCQDWDGSHPLSWNQNLNQGWFVSWSQKEQIRDPMGRWPWYRLQWALFCRNDPNVFCWIADDSDTFLVFIIVSTLVKQILGKKFVNRAHETNPCMEGWSILWSDYIGASDDKWTRIVNINLNSICRQSHHLSCLCTREVNFWPKSSTEVLQWASWTQVCSHSWAKCIFKWLWSLSLLLCSIF